MALVLCTFDGLLGLSIKDTWVEMIRAEEKEQQKEVSRCSSSRRAPLSAPSRGRPSDKDSSDSRQQADKPIKVGSIQEGTEGSLREEAGTPLQTPKPNRK